MEKIIKKEIYIDILSSIIFCIIGILFMLYPVKTMDAGVIIVAITLAFVGIYTIVGHVKYEYYSNSFGHGLIYGIFSVILAIFLFINPNYGTIMISIVMGIWMILGSIVKLQVAMSLKELKTCISIFTMISAILMFTCGMIAICNPISFSMVIVSILGVMLIIYSVVEIINSIFLLKYVK